MTLFALYFQYIVDPTVPLETMGPLARGKTSSLPNLVAANSPRWDENRNHGKDKATESRSELDAAMSRLKHNSD